MKPYRFCALILALLALPQLSSAQEKLTEVTQDTAEASVTFQALLQPGPRPWVDLNIEIKNKTSKTVKCYFYVGIDAVGDDPATGDKARVMSSEFGMFPHRVAPGETKSENYAHFVEFDSRLKGDKIRYSAKLSYPSLQCRDYEGAKQEKTHPDDFPKNAKRLSDKNEYVTAELVQMLVEKGPDKYWDIAVVMNRAKEDTSTNLRCDISASFRKVEVYQDAKGNWKVAKKYSETYGLTNPQTVKISAGKSIGLGRMGRFWDQIEVNEENALESFKIESCTEEK